MTPPTVDYFVKLISLDYLLCVLQLIKFLKGFNAEDRVKLAKVVAYCLANGLGSSSCIASLFEEHLVKDGTSQSNAFTYIQCWCGIGVWYRRHMGRSILAVSLATILECPITLPPEPASHFLSSLPHAIAACLAAAAQGGGQREGTLSQQGPR